MMISTKKLIKMARKWRQIAAIGRKRISLPGSTSDATSLAVKKGHFVVYSIDGKRFVFPITYLNSYIFRELLMMSEQEFGLPSDAPITFPCDAAFMNFATNLIHRHATQETQKDLLMCLANSRSCSLYSYSYVHEQETNQQELACAC